jgi:hypothetical protein
LMDEAGQKSLNDVENFEFGTLLGICIRMRRHQ